MQIFLVRHGIAIEDPGASPDGDRSLTPEGRKKTHRVAELLAKQAGRLDRVLTSPLVRAVQTAEILAVSLGCEDVRVTRALVPGAPLSAVDAVIGDAADLGRVALVGHEPAMSSIAAHLLGLRAFPRPFKKAGVCAITLEEPGAPGAFDWLIVPKGPKVETELEPSE